MSCATGLTKEVCLANGSSGLLILADGFLASADGHKYLGQEEYFIRRTEGKLLAGRSFADLHREWVESAIQQGEEIAPEVLFDHPDLIAKYGFNPS